MTASGFPARGMRVAHIALGANLGDRAATIAEALRRIGALGEALAVSRLVETPAWPDPEAAPPYLNGAMALRTALGPLPLLRALRGIERDLGRERPYRNAPRTIDLDLLLMEDLVLDDPELTLPHPRMHRRDFVLGPLAEIAPEAVHPVLRRTVGALLADLAG